MLVFVDESGDAGMKIKEGSSRYFAVALVIFEENDEAVSCDQRIQLLKKELGWKYDNEFHFKRNSDRVCRAFLSAVAPYSFFYYGVLIDKDSMQFQKDGFKNKESFYKYVCGLVFESAKEKLRDATVLIDESGNEDFRRRLAQYLRGKMNQKVSVVKKVKMQRSQSNNLLQLADYIAGSIVVPKEGKENTRMNIGASLPIGKCLLKYGLSKTIMRQKKTPGLSLAGTRR